MARPVVILALVLLASLPSVSAHAGDRLLTSVVSAGGGSDGCLDFEGDSEEGPVKAGQEDPGIFVGVPAGETDGLDSSGGGYTGFGVFYRSKDCELPGPGDFHELAMQAL